MKNYIQPVFSFQTLLLFIAVMSLSSYGIFAQQPVLNWLGTLGGNSSHAYGISSNGLVVVGVSTDSNYNEHAFRWTNSSGMQDLGTLGGNTSKALGVSADGSVIVGSAYNADGVRRAFRWTEASGMQDLGVDDYSEAVAVSDDGAFIVYNNGMDGFAYRWSSGGSDSLGTLGGNQSIATDISSDGSVIVGYSYYTDNAPYAFRWVSGTGMEKIGTFYSFAQGISGDGTTVTGSETGAAGLHRAFRWTAANGFEFDIAGNFSYGLALSNDGKIIVGDGDGAIRVTSAGVELLAQVYSTLLTTNSTLIDATGISSDGLFITGNGDNNETGFSEGYYLAVNGITAVNGIQKKAIDYTLSQNYPNPFNPSTSISYEIPKESKVQLDIYNILGEKVAELVNEFQKSGKYTVKWNAQNFASGVYIYRIRSNEFAQSKKLILLK